MSLQGDTAFIERHGTLSAELRPEWGIWGPNGGYISSIAMRAVGMRAEAGQRPVSLSVQYLGKAVFGPIEVVVTPKKRGSTACFGVSLIQGSKTFLEGQVWTTNRTEGPRISQARRPDVAGYQGLETLAAYKQRRGESEHPFWENFETRPVGFTGPPNPEPLGHVLRQWTRYLEWTATDDPFLDACRAVVLIDTLVWPAHWRGCLTNPAYVAPSLDLSIWFHSAASEADWLLADAHADTAGDGIIHGGVRIWAEDRLVATGGSQLLVMLPRT